MPRVLGEKPVTDGFVAIGWKEVGDLGKLADTREAFREIVARTYPDSKPGSHPVTGGTLFKFVHEMDLGDVVIHPSKIDRLVHIGVVDGDYVHIPSGEELPNRRKVKWAVHVPRARFSQPALHEIGTAVTLSQVRNNLEEFLAALKGESLEPEEIDEAVAESPSEEAEEATRDFVLKRLKAQLDPYQFEHFVAHLLERMGYHTRVTQQSGDGGIDIIASKDELGFEKPLIKVQCKQRLSSIGTPEVAQLYGQIDKEEHGLFVALGDYTSQARVFERSKPNLRLIDGSALVDLIFNHYDRFDPAYQTLLPLKRTYVPARIAKE
jgi:restriction system protein